MKVTVSAVTGNGSAALHGISIAGVGADQLLEKLLSRVSVKGSWHADLLDGTGEVLDDIVCLRWPNSEESYLLTTHGNVLILDQVIQRCMELGAIHQKENPDLFQVEDEAQGCSIQKQALSLLKEARSPEVCSFLLSQGSVDGFAGEVCRWVSDPPAISELDQLIVQGHRGLQLLSPPRVVLTGVTNAGKSTLFNRLVGKDRSIVTPIEGTTRDLVVEVAPIKGYPIELIDGAGSRETSDPVEAEGLRRLELELQNADLILEILLPGQATRFKNDQGRVLSLYSRCDEWISESVDLETHLLRVSAVTGEGLQALEEAILEKLHGGTQFDLNEPCPFLPEHVIFLQDLRSSLQSGGDVVPSILRFLEGVADCHP